MISETLPDWDQLNRLIAQSFQALPTEGKYKTRPNTFGHYAHDSNIG